LLANRSELRSQLGVDRTLSAGELAHSIVGTTERLGERNLPVAAEERSTDMGELVRTDHSSQRCPRHEAEPIRIDCLRRGNYTCWSGERILWARVDWRVLGFSPPLQSDLRVWWRGSRSSIWGTPYLHTAFYRPRRIRRKYEGQPRRFPESCGRRRKSDNF